MDIYGKLPDGLVAYYVSAELSEMSYLVQPMGQ